MLAGISAPPMPSIAFLVLAGLGCVLIGALLNLRGRKTGRLILALFAAGAAAASAPWIAQRIPFKNVWIVGAAAAVAAGLFSFVLSRLFWAIVLGGVLAAAGVAVVAHLNAGAMAEKPAWEAQELATFSSWSLAVADYLLRWVEALWHHSPAAVALAAGGPVIVCIAVEMLLPKSILILASSALGAAGVVGGVGLLVLAGRPASAQAWVERIHLPAAAAAALALLGAAYQARAELRETAPEKPEVRAEPGVGKIGPDGEL